MNYFYDILNVDLRDKIINIVIESHRNDIENNRKAVISMVYTPWDSYEIQCPHGNEYYKHITSKNGKTWYFDYVVFESSCGGIGSLKSNDIPMDKSIKIGYVHAFTNMVDKLLHIKRQRIYNLSRKFNMNMHDIDCDIFVGNYWCDNMYVSPIDDHMYICNDCYENGILISA